MVDPVDNIDEDVETDVAVVSGVDSVDVCAAVTEVGAVDAVVEAAPAEVDAPEAVGVEAAVPASVVVEDAAPTDVDDPPAAVVEAAAPSVVDAIAGEDV